MVTVTNGRLVLRITQGAYDAYYSSNGFTLCGSSEDPTLGPQGTSEETQKVTHYSEVPLSEMTFSQLCEYAEELGIPYDTSSTAKQLRNLIRRKRREDL